MMKQVRSQRIERLRHAFPDEWLLIEVDRFDARTTTPVTGRLLARSKLRDPLEQQAAKAKRTKRLTYLVFGRDTLPQGYAAAF